MRRDWTNKLRLPMQGVLIGLAALMLSPVQAAEPAATASKQESIGVTTGLAVGAAAGGPFGAVLGAAAGAWLGDRYHRKNVQQAALAGEVHALHSSLAVADARGERLAAALEGTQALATSVGFRTGEWQLQPEAEAQLAHLGRLVAGLPELQVFVSGHADARGPVELNQMLSERRAEHVARVLEAAGIGRERLIIAAHGETQAAAAETDLDGCALERRVTVRLERSADAAADVLARRE